jgi:hypothetical protein
MKAGPVHYFYFLAILAQKLVFGSPPPATVLEEEDIEQALALDTD